MKALSNEKEWDTMKHQPHQPYSYTTHAKYLDSNSEEYHHIRIRDQGNKQAAAEAAAMDYIHTNKKKRIPN